MRMLTPPRSRSYMTYVEKRWPRPAGVWARGHIILYMNRYKSIDFMFQLIIIDRSLERNEYITLHTCTLYILFSMEGITYFPYTSSSVIFFRVYK